jgi:hypothetical protein
MLDLSKYAKDKDSYIVRLEIDELFQNFKVIYASGREEIHGFSIHNYQVFIYKMEEQFQEYKKEYERDLNDQFNEDVKKRIIASVASMMGIAITCGFDIHLAIKIILAFIGSMIVIYNLNKIADKRSKLTKDAEKAAIIEVLLQHKEDIALNVTDPGTGRKDKWYMIDINNVDQFSSVLEMAMYTMPYSNPVIKEEMEKDLDKAFSDAYTLKMKNKNS